MMFAEAAKHVTDTLAGVGVRATVDPRSLNLPAVWVTPDTCTAGTLDPDGVTVVTLNLFLITSGGTAPADLERLDGLMSQVYKAFPGHSETFEAVSVNLPNHGAALPALLTTIELNLTESE